MPGRPLPSLLKGQHAPYEYTLDLLDLERPETKVRATVDGPESPFEAYERLKSLYPDFEQKTKVPFLYRIFEIFVAFFALIIFAPVLLFVAVIIAFDTGVPVLFRQQRLRLGAQPFRFVKFRTLFVDAQQRFPELYKYSFTMDEVSGMAFKIKNDPRVTPAGRWLRKSTLDELPNFWNVLTGEMALVGPRPEIPQMLRYYNDAALRKFIVRPGITGLAQCSGRGNLGFLEGIELDLEYVEKRSVLFDLQIIWKTIVSVLRREGAF